MHKKSEVLMKPMISVIVPTFNRAHTIGRTIDSILLQTYIHFEIIVVEDGSDDNTLEILKKYKDKRIRIIRHSENKGVTAAKNTGLNNIAGEWFTILDSDDEIIPTAFERMLKFPLELDVTITAVTCNCLDTTTGQFSGKGLDKDQYIDFSTIILKCKGEFWGITKTELLWEDRFNENLNGLESTLWYKIYERSHRYYIHEALRIYHTTGTDRLSNNISLEKESSNFQALAKDTHYLELFKKYQPDTFAKDCLLAVLYLKSVNKQESAKYYLQQLKIMKDYPFYRTVAFLSYHTNPYIIRQLIKYWRFIK